MELVVFRLVQECLTNIHRHSGGKNASIRITREEGRTTLAIRDTGKGVSPERLPENQSGGSGVGIRGMRERLRQFKGEIKIQSDAAGTRIFVAIPVPKSLTFQKAWRRKMSLQRSRSKLRRRQLWQE